MATENEYAVSGVMPEYNKKVVSSTNRGYLTNEQRSILKEKICKELEIAGVLKKPKDLSPRVLETIIKS